MSVRLRRLSADYDKVRTEFAGHKYIKVETLSGSPPERYRITFHVKGLRWDAAQNRPIVVSNHVAEIYLHNEYPREKPQCRLLTEIWHPNFGPYICIGDHWAAGESLVDVIVQIGDMIQYKSYNPKSPLNGLAARWAVENQRFFPVGNVDLYQAEPDISLDEWEAEDDEPEIELHDDPPADDDSLKIDFT